MPLISQTNSDFSKSYLICFLRVSLQEIMPKYFTTCRLASFQRQLNLYGFRRITEGRGKGAYTHDYFEKGNRALCRKMKRQKTRVKATQHSSLGALATLASSQSQSSTNLELQARFHGMIAANRAHDLRNFLNAQQLPPTQGLGYPAVALRGRLSAGSTLGVPTTSGIGVAAAAAAQGDVGYAVLQEALRQGLLSDANLVRQQQSNPASLTKQDLQHKSHEQETEQIMQLIWQQQQQERQQKEQTRRHSKQLDRR
jgi:HSF-type DNA-binding